MKRNRKSKKIFVLLPIILGGLIFILSILNSQNNNIIGIVVGTLLIIIPYIYTVSPIVKERYKESNNMLNRLSQNTFTDRKHDLQYLIEILNTHKIVQLSGKDSQCGKSWLALKLVDYINYPKDEEFKEYNYLKNQLSSAYYIDMNEVTDAELNLFFKDNIVTNKTLIVVDHVKKIEHIFSKQEMYDFVLLFISESNINTKASIYNISEFKRENIPDLQKKINKNYDNIESLCKPEIETLYDLTSGNIGKIHFLLERQEYVQWIKQITYNLQTQYDKQLNGIQLFLFNGQYILAKKLLSDFEIQYKLVLQNNNDIYFKYILMKSDCEHLLNNYQDALIILMPLKQLTFRKYNINNKVETLEAHYYKHLWKCDISLTILQKIQPSNIRGLTDSLGILVAKYFVDDMVVPNTDFDTLDVFYKTFEKCKKNSPINDPQNAYKIMRNESIYLYYKNKYRKKEILEPINSVIKIYKDENNRLLANAYFIRAEINRLFQNYKEALLDYNRCLAQTDDNNIKIQVNIIKYYMDNIKNIDIFKSDNHLSKEQIYNLCKNKNAYGTLLIQRLNSIELEDPYKKQILSCFDHRIMTIL